MIVKPGKCREWLKMGQLELELLVALRSLLPLQAVQPSHRGRAELTPTPLASGLVTLVPCASPRHYFHPSASFASLRAGVTVTPRVPLRSFPSPATVPCTPAIPLLGVDVPCDGARRHLELPYPVRTSGSSSPPAPSPLTSHCIPRAERQTRLGGTSWPRSPHGSAAC